MLQKKLYVTPGRKEEKMPKLNVQHLQRAKSIPTDGKLMFNIVRYRYTSILVTFDIGKFDLW